MRLPDPHHLLKLVNASKQQTASKDFKTLAKKAVAFSCISFGPETPFYTTKEAQEAFLTEKKTLDFSYHYPMILGDQRGHIYAADFHRNA